MVAVIRQNVFGQEILGTAPPRDGCDKLDGCDKVECLPADGLLQREPARGHVLGVKKDRFGRIAPVSSPSSTAL